MTVLQVTLTINSSRADLDALDARVADMVSRGQLMQAWAADDADVPGRRHESFLQVHQGVPVEGGGISRQRRDNRTVSAFGANFLRIDLAV
jgi:hypothetical protein